MSDHQPPRPGHLLDRLRHACEATSREPDGQPDEPTRLKWDVVVPDGSRAVLEGVNAGIPAVVQSPGGAFSQGIDDLAKLITGELPPAPPAGPDTPGRAPLPAAAAVAIPRPRSRLTRAIGQDHPGESPPDEPHREVLPVTVRKLRSR